MCVNGFLCRFIQKPIFSWIRQKIKYFPTDHNVYRHDVIKVCEFNIGVISGNSVFCRILLNFVSEYIKKC